MLRFEITHMSRAFFAISYRANVACPLLQENDESSLEYKPSQLLRIKPKKNSAFTQGLNKIGGTHHRGGGIYQNLSIEDFSRVLQLVEKHGLKGQDCERLRGTLDSIIQLVDEYSGDKTALYKSCLPNVKSELRSDRVEVDLNSLCEGVLQDMQTCLKEYDTSSSAKSHK